jgi:hypothetical protein
MAEPRIAHQLFHLLGSAQLDQDSAARFRFAETFLDLALSRKIEVGPDFVT